MVSAFITVSPRVVEVPVLQTGTEASRGYQQGVSFLQPPFNHRKHHNLQKKNRTRACLAMQ